ncbi:MAG: helical backbone metal receptor [Pseudomonadota bacterium]
MSAPKLRPSGHAAIDQMGREVPVPAIPRRIVSLVPSQTELLVDLGLIRRLVGITRYCIHPAEAVKHIPVIGGTKRFSTREILDFEPDLVIGNKEENVEGLITELAEHCAVWMSDIYTFDDAMAMITALGDITGTHEAAERLRQTIEQGWNTMPRATAGSSVAYLIWRKPWMAVASGTFIDDVLTRLGFRNAFAGQARYPELSLEALREARPDVVMLSSEPFPFDERHIAELGSQLPDARVVLVNGEMFSWYGSRLQLAPAYFASLLPQLDGEAA